MTHPTHNQLSSAPTAIETREVAALLYRLANYLRADGYARLATADDSDEARSLAEKLLQDAEKASETATTFYEMKSTISVE